MFNFKKYVLLGSIMTHLVSCSSKRYQGPPSDHFNGERFFNPTPFREKSFWDVVRWKLTSTAKKWPIVTKNIAQPQIIDNKTLAPNQVHITFVNHATFLIQLKDINILTDPIWSERSSPFQWLGPKRIRPPGMSLNQLPHIDVVLISHNHYDHMDEFTIKELEKRFSPQFYVGLGDHKIMKEFGAKKVIELDWWQTSQALNVVLTYTPAQHFSARTPSDSFRSLWGGFMITTDQSKNIYFTGDAGYSRHFKDIFNKFQNIHLAFIPIGAYEPRSFMMDAHMNPEEAVQAHLDLNSHLSIGKHFGTFPLTDEGVDEPKIDLKKHLAIKNLTSETFLTLEEGESRTFLLK